MPSSTPASHLPPSSSRWSWSTGERGQLTSVGWLASALPPQLVSRTAPSAIPRTTCAYDLLQGSPCRIQRWGSPRPTRLHASRLSTTRRPGPGAKHTLGHLTDLRTLERADLVAEIAQLLAVDIQHVHDEVRLAAMAQLKAHPCSGSLVRPGDAVAPAAGRRRQATSRSRSWLFDPDRPRPVGLNVEQVAARVEVLAGRAVGGPDLVNQVA